MSRVDAKSQMMIELAHAMAALACDDDANLLGIITAIHTRLVNQGRQPSLPGVPAATDEPKAAEARAQAAMRVFAYWQQRCSHSTAKYTTERARAILSRLKDGYTEAEIRKAIDGASVAAYVSEETGQKYDDLTLICRNGSKLESFIARGVTATGAIVVVVGESAPVEDQIAQLRRSMADLKKDGRGHEYEQAAEELRKLMSRRAL